MLGYLQQEDHEPLRPLNPPRDDQCSIDNEVRNEFYNVLGGRDDEDDDSDATETAWEGESPKQSASQSQAGSTDEREEPVEGQESEEDDDREPIQLLKTPDGKIYFRGYRRGKDMVQNPDGTQVIYSPSADPDSAAKLGIRPNTLVTPLRVGDVAAGSFTPAVANRTSSSIKATKKKSVSNGTPEDGGGHLVMPVPPRVRAKPMYDSSTASKRA